MHFPAMLTSLSLMTSAALPAPTILPRPAFGAQNVVYWGQNGGRTVEADLSTYCTADSGIDIIVLAFLYEYGSGNNIASGTIGQLCYIAPSGEGQQCDALAAAIDKWQNLWDAYGNALNGSVPRPFGSTFVNGWDFNIESNSGNQYYQYMISTLRSNFASDSSRKYVITGAPQCPVPEPNMNVIITNAQFDYLWVQFYNNPGCSVNGPINYDDWKTNIAKTPSANSKVFIGVPASPLGATGTSRGAQYYLEPSALATLVGQYDSDAAFGGVMMWSAGFSDTNVNNGCTYAQEAKHILTAGSAC